MAMGHHKKNRDRDSHDFYPTPEPFTKVLLDNMSFKGNILEPACGEGHMSRVIADAGYDVISSDVVDRGYGKVKDFFDIYAADNIITNPPYKIGLEFTEHAIDISKFKVALLMKLTFLESIGRYRFFKRRPPCKIIVISNRMKNSQFGHAWFIWDNEKENYQTILTWDITDG